MLEKQSGGICPILYINSLGLSVTRLGKGVLCSRELNVVGQHERAGHGKGAGREDLLGGSEVSIVFLSIFLSICLPGGSFNIFPNKLCAAQASFSPRNMLSLTLSVLYTGL
jgi:hypothetical protein